MLYEPKHDHSDKAVCILTPCGGYTVHTKFCQSVANMISYSWHHGLKIYQMGVTERMVVDWARNDLARRAVDHISSYTGAKFTHLLWLDDDHVFREDLAVRLIDHDVDMVSALYYGRTEHLPVVYVKDFTEDKHKHFPLTEVPNCLFEADAVGFGALMMRRDVFERVPEPWFTIDWQAGEDIAFCVKAKEFGVKIYCDGQYKLGHIGPPNIVTEKDYRQYLADNQEKFGNKIKVALGGIKV